MTDQEDSRQEKSPRRQQRSLNRWLVTLILGAVLLLLLVVGYVVVDTVLSLGRATSSVPGAVATQVQQVLNPTPTIIADQQTVVLQVQSLSRLETAAYTIEKVITAESGEGPLGFLFRDKLLLIAQGQVIAGVDLGRMSADDVRIAGDTVYITLPAAEIFVATLDNDSTYVYDRQTAVLGQQVDLETLARQRAEEEILSAALEDGILDLAQKNAESAVGSLIRALGFSDVIFIKGTPGPGQNLGN
jgi:hypothetical protein